jgi:hypothetical protein
MKRKNALYLARKVGSRPQACVRWSSDGRGLIICWENPSGSDTEGYIDPKLARLLARRIDQALRD